MPENPHHSRAVLMALRIIAEIEAAMAEAGIEARARGILIEQRQSEEGERGRPRRTIH